MTIACPDCGSLEELPRLGRLDRSVCVRCPELETTSGRSLSAALACSLAVRFGLLTAVLGALIFCTSILTPAMKILGIGWCVLSLRRRSQRHLAVKTRALRLLAELGSSTAGWGATAFMMMTFTTMVASVTFDPRLVCDAAATARDD